MRRDLDLIRNLLLHFEEKESWQPESAHSVSEKLGYGEDFEAYKVVVYHLILLEEAKLLSTFEAPTNDDDVIADFMRLTWEGHDFLDSIKDKSRYEKIKKAFLEEAGGWTIELIKGFASQLIKHQVGLPS